MWTKTNWLINICSKKKKEWKCCCVPKSCPTICNLLDCNTPHSSFLHYLPVCSNSYPLSRLAISSSADSFSFSLQSFPALADSFPMTQLFTSGGQIIGASASVLSMNIQGWFPLGFTGLIYFQSKGLSRVFSSTTVQKHQFFSTQPSLWSNSQICT